jgi:hypothetical protein
MADAPVFVRAGIKTIEFEKWKAGIVVPSMDKLPRHRHPGDGRPAR